jgi:hypothetical protein
MDKVSVPHIEQQLRLNRSMQAINTDKSLFYLYLSMLERDLSTVPRFADAQTTNDIIHADIGPHYYKHPALQFTEQDFMLQTSFSGAVAQQSSSTLQLLNAFFPQGLAQHNNHLRLDDDVVDGLDYFAKQRLNKSILADVDSFLEQNVIQVDETLLFDLIPKAAEFTL